MTIFKNTSLKTKLIITIASLVVVGMGTLGTVNIIKAKSVAMDLLNSDAKNVLTARSDAIAQWSANKGNIVKSLEKIGNETEALPALVQAAKGGGFDTVYVGYENKKYVFSVP